MSEFWNQVDKSGECWLWTGCRDAQGLPEEPHDQAHGRGDLGQTDEPDHARAQAHV